MTAAPVSPILLSDKSNVVRVVLDESACARDVAPVSPISLKDIFNVVRVELDESACDRAIAPESPISLRDKFHVAREESLRAIWRRSPAKKGLKLVFAMS